MGADTSPMENSTRRRSRMAEAKGIASRAARVWRPCASDHRRTSSAAPSSSQRYGSRTSTPCRTSTTSSVRVGGGGAGVLIEAALATADVPPAALRLEGPATLEGRIEVAGGSRAERRRPARARTIAAGAGRAVSSAGAAAHSRRTRRPILRFVDPQGTALEVLPVHQADRLLCRLVVLELHEGEPSGTSGLTVGGDFRVHHLARRAEGLDQLVARDVEAQVSDKDLVRNGRLSQSTSRPPVVAAAA